MIARVLDIPDDERALPRWLDEQLAGPNLHHFVAELAAVHDASPRPVAVEEAVAWLGDALPGLLAGGTAKLDRRRFGELLRRPGLLAAVQEIVFVEGGDYWNDVVSKANQAPSQPLPVLPDQVAATPPITAAAGPPVAPTHLWLPRTVAALAASLLLALATWSILQPGPATPWGWNRPTALAAAAAPEYLENLAAAAGEWSAEVPQTEAALARRLGELLAGCDRLIAAPHESLAAGDRAWLVDRCGAWREAIAGHLAALKADHDVAAVRGAADATVAKLVDALKTRGREITRRSSES